LNSGAIRLVMSLKFARKQEFKLKKIKRSIYVRNVVILSIRKDQLSIQWRSIFIIKNMRKE